MIYQFETFYQSKDFPSKETIILCATAVLEWCSYYKAELNFPKKEVTIKKKEGDLPQDIMKKESLISDLLSWMDDNSDMKGSASYNLSLYSSNIAAFDNQKFMYGGSHSLDHSFILQLSEEEFMNLQKTLKENNLPEDLFFESSKTICVPVSGKSFPKKLMRIFGFKQCFSPKQWENNQKGES